MINQSALRHEHLVALYHISAALSFSEKLVPSKDSVIPLYRMSPTDVHLFLTLHYADDKLVSCRSNH